MVPEAGQVIDPGWGAELEIPTALKQPGYIPQRPPGSRPPHTPLREVDVPRFLRGQASLNDQQAIEMAQLALDLESTMGFPVDMECAYAGGELYLLQCRPITTLK